MPGLFDTNKLPSPLYTSILKGDISNNVNKNMSYDQNKVTYELYQVCM